MTACHLVSNGNLSLLRDINADCLIHSRRKLVAVFSCENLGIHDNTIFPVRHFQGSIPYLSCLLAEDGAQEPLLCGQFCLSLRSHLSYQNIACTNLGADTNNSALVQIL